MRLALPSIALLSLSLVASAANPPGVDSLTTKGVRFKIETDGTVSEASVGSNATILMGSTIGHHSVVAAGAVVTEGSTFEPYSLIAGVPAVRKGDVRWQP